jgi:hypothetical protein
MNPARGIGTTGESRIKFTGSSGRASGLAPSFFGPSLLQRLAEIIGGFAGRGTIYCGKGF